MKYSLYELHSLEELKESKHFWMQKVAEASYDQVLLDDNSNPSPFQKAVIRTDLNRQLSERIGKISGNVDLLTYIIMMSAFQMQVYRLIHKNFFINIPAYEESNEESTEPADNLYLPYKTLLNDEMSVKEIIGNCKKELIEVYKHQFYPMQHVFAEAGMEETDRPLGQFSFSMKGLHQPQDIQQLMEAYKDQIHICIERSEQTISLEVTYNSNRFGKHTINSFLNCYVQVLEHAMSNVNAAISDIDLVTAEETVQILDHFNDTKQDYPAIRTMKEIFEEEAAFAQENIAVVSNGVELGYRELNERANQLARVLRAKGITRDSIVAILCDKSVETIIAMVAVIKAGGAYLPIDEEYPEARIRYLLEDSGSRILIGKENQAKRLNLEETGVMFIDVAGREASQESKKNLSEINQPTDLAYVIYTSGTTGKPKGVCVEQKSLIKIVKNAGYIDIKEGDKLLQSGSLSFDASVQQIWLALLNGIPLHMEKKELMLDLERIEEYIHKHQITHIIFPTTLFNQICQERIETFQNIRYVIAGGDVISSKQVSRLVKKYKDITVVNGYGPTENTVISTAYMIAGEWDEDKSVPIGKPVSNSTAYIMDKHHKLLPVGVPGELCVGGDGVARGYLNRPELAEEKFVLNPYVPGERIYKTGDLARWLPDGNLEFLGRMDQQVKIRGYRIELGEIEKQLTKHPQVKEAVVIDRKDESGASYLCGYLVGDGELSVAEVKEHLHRELPDYMVPAYLITLEKLPLTPNGKIDKKALPEPDVSQSEREIVAPRNDVERAIASVWCEVLGLKQVGIEQSFFDIGGDSIKSIQIVSRLRRHGVKLEVKDIMQYKTIAEIARHIKQTETVASQD
ncbi:non-ribosomal peptide synthetase, partial [Brevibacillus sp. SYSU BS000544]|uniref:non-ribosomal peptide synthetase n=1 Tax=Brevibacillus sp. SYSU BS000544 TaxID=3416443 RepID=UPI003CE4B984